jgi:hypothetical protein
MRSVLRPAFVGLAVVGMSFAGVASAQACDKPDSSDVHVNAVEDSFNDCNNNTIIGSSFIGDFHCA